MLEQQIDETDAQIAILMAKKTVMKKELLLIKSKEQLVKPLSADGEQRLSFKRTRSTAYLLAFCAIRTKPDLYTEVKNPLYVFSTYHEQMMKK